MSKTWITKVGHFLNENGELPAELPGPARNLAEFICSLVQSVNYAFGFKVNPDRFYPESMCIFREAYPLGQNFLDYMHKCTYHINMEIEWHGLFRPNSRGCLYLAWNPDSYHIGKKSNSQGN